MFLCDQFGALFYAILIFASLAFRVLFYRFLSFTFTLQIQSGTQPQPGELKAKELLFDPKIFGAWLNWLNHYVFSMLFLHVICCWYYPWYWQDQGIESLRLLLYPLSWRTVYCLSCCDVGLGWLQVWFQEVRWQEELGPDATVWFVDSQEFFSDQHHCLHGITVSYSWWTRYMLHLSREALQNASAEVCCSSVYYASNTCFTLKFSYQKVIFLITIKTQWFKQAASNVGKGLMINGLQSVLGRRNVKPGWSAKAGIDRSCRGRPFHWSGADRVVEAGENGVFVDMWWKAPQVCFNLLDNACHKGSSPEFSYASIWSNRITCTRCKWNIHEWGHAVWIDIRLGPSGRGLVRRNRIAAGTTRTMPVRNLCSARCFWILLQGGLIRTINSPADFWFLPTEIWFCNSPPWQLAARAEKKSNQWSSLGLSFGVLIKLTISADHVR